eukprot:UC4_evm1s439
MRPPRRLKCGTRVFLNGDKVKADRTLIQKNGAVTLPNGIVIKPDGTVIFPDGSVDNLLPSPADLKGLMLATPPPIDLQSITEPEADLTTKLNHEIEPTLCNETKLSPSRSSASSKWRQLRNARTVVSELSSLPSLDTFFTIKLPLQPQEKSEKPKDPGSESHLRLYQRLETS